MSEKNLNIVNVEDAKKKISDIVVVGDVDMFQLLCKASSKEQGWMQSAKACQIPYVGCIVQVTTQQGKHVAEALTFIPDTRIVPDINGGKRLFSNRRSTDEEAALETSSRLPPVVVPPVVVDPTPVTTTSIADDLELPPDVTAAQYWELYFATLQDAAAELLNQVDDANRSIITDCMAGIKEAMDKLFIATTEEEKRTQLATLEQYQSVLIGQKTIMHFTYQDYLLNALSIALKIAGKLVIGVALA